MLLNGFYFLGLAIVFGCYLLRAPKDREFVFPEKVINYIAWILTWYVLVKLLSLSSDIFNGNRVFAGSISGTLVADYFARILVSFGNTHNPVTIAIHVWYFLQLSAAVFSWLIRRQVAKLLVSLHRQV